MFSQYNYYTKQMGCDVNMTFVAESAKEADLYFTQAHKMIQKYERVFSRFDEGSELSELNTKKSRKISRLFREVYFVAESLYRETEGIFNPLVQLDHIGYDVSFEKIGEKESVEKNEEYNNRMEDIVWNGEELFLQETQKLDFGGFLKGYLAQKIAQETPGKQGVIINIGGDLYVRGWDEKENRFVIAIKNPYDEKKDISVSLCDQALCTSGVYKRKWKHRQQEVHHIIESEKKMSAQKDLLSATVIGENGALADAYATSAIVMGSEKARIFFSSKEISFVIINKQGEVMQSEKLRIII